MNNSQIKRAEMIALKSIGNNPAAGNQWHDTERNIKVERSNWKRTALLILVILIGLLADAYIVTYVMGG